MNNPLSLSRPHLSSYFKPSFTDFSFTFICYTPANRSLYSSYTFLKSAWEKEFLKRMAFHYDTKTVIVKLSCSFFSGWIMNKKTFNKFLQHKTHGDSSFNLCICCIFVSIDIKSAMLYSELCPFLYLKLMSCKLSYMDRWTK